MNLSKSVFAVPQIKFLCYLITSEGSPPLPKKVQNILNYKQSKTFHELRTFLGLINFYCHYLKDAANNQALLHEFLKDTKKKDKSKIQWTEEASKQFKRCKNDLTNTVILPFPKSELSLALFTDATDMAIGSVLHQLENSTWKPIAF